MEKSIQVKREINKRFNCFIILVDNQVGERRGERTGGKEKKRRIDNKKQN